jgi:hypothetical protein
MDAEKVNLFLATKGEKFPAESIPMIRERLESLPADRELAVSAMEVKDPTTALLLSLLVFFGFSGVDRIYIGDIGLGIAKFLTGGGCGIWAIIDFFLIMDAAKRKNLEKLMLAIG